MFGYNVTANGPGLPAVGALATVSLGRHALKYQIFE